MTVLDLLRQTTIDPREAELLLAFVLNKDRTYVKAHGQDKVEAKIAKVFLNLIQRRKKHEPIAYLTGEQPFFGRDFVVNRHTLIPRPETEILVELVKQSSVVSRKSSVKTNRTLKDVKGRLVVVDVGTGSGCLAVTLALECPDARVIASDVSEAALKVARQNAKHLGAKVEFVKDGLLGKKLLSVIPAKAGIQKNKQKQNRMDPRIRKDDNVVFVANLPYLPSRDKKTMMPDVAKYEPAKALFTSGDGSMLVRKLLTQIRTFFGHSEWSAAEPKNPTKPSNQLISSVRSFDYVRPTHSAQDDISVFLEIDPPQAKELSSLAKKLFPDKKVQIKKDLCGKDRFLAIL